jgi:3-methyladenine DNA glycosylase AlkD
MVIQKIREELKKNIDPEYKKSIKRFFKEEITCYGVRTPVVRKISAKYFSKIKEQSKEEIYGLCQQLLESGMMEERGTAFDWAFRLKSTYSPSDFRVFESWLKKYVTNWGACDHICALLGTFIDQFPEFIPQIKEWTASKNRWLRRASAVSMIYSVRKRKYLEDVFEIADLLLRDKDDMVQKGYGWLLKEASNVYPQEVFRYVMEHKSEMPRTALRYAIEKMPPEWKKKAMAKD